MADLFWNIATSSPVLGGLAALFIAAFCVAHVPLIGRLLPSIEPYLVAAQLVSVIAAAALCFLIGFRLSDERAETRQLKNDLQWTENELQQQKATSEEKEKLADQKAAEADQLKSQVDDYEKALADRPTNAGVNCDALDDTDLDGLQSLRRRTGAGQRNRAAAKGLRRSGSPSPAAGP